MTDSPQLAPVFLSFHAVERFRERSRNALGVRYTDAQARKRICGLLERCEAEHPSETVQRRILALRARRCTSEDRTVEYWRVGGWRFVIVMEAPKWRRVLVTCERIVPGEN